MTYLKIPLITLMLAYSFLPWRTQAFSVDSCMEELCIVYFNKLKTLASDKDVSAISAVAELYYKGYGTEKDLSKSIHYFRQASRHQFTYAQYRTGIFYLMEEDFIDHQEGLKYLRIAAVNDHTESAFLLAVIYGTGELGIKDVGESDKWLEKALQMKHVKAESYARSLYENGQVNTEHYVKVNALISSLINESPKSEEISKKEAETQLHNNSINDVVTVSSSTYSDTFDYVKSAFTIDAPEIKPHVNAESEKRLCTKLFSCYLVNKEMSIAGQYKIVSQ